MGLQPAAPTIQQYDHETGPEIRLEEDASIYGTVVKFKKATSDAAPKLDDGDAIPLRSADSAAPPDKKDSDDDHAGSAVEGSEDESFDEDLRKYQSLVDKLTDFHPWG